VDAARAFGTGCFKDHRTHDLRGLSESEIHVSVPHHHSSEEDVPTILFWVLFFFLQSVEHWKQFFRDHKTYFKVGRVNHRPIDPTSPLPVHCDPKKDAEQKARWGMGPPAAAAQEKQPEVGAKASNVEPQREAQSGDKRTHGEL
jgi:hypothetical protein